MNLDNVFKDIVLLKPLPDTEIKEIIIRRLSQDVKYFTEGTLNLIARYADGNPRDALLAAQKVVFENFSLSKIDEKATYSFLSKLSRRFLSRLSLTSKQEEAFKILKEFKGTREDAISALRSKGIKRTTAYSIIEKFIKEGILKEQEGIYRISGKLLFY